jgi:hypothetical protein
MPKYDYFIVLCLGGALGIGSMTDSIIRERKDIIRERKYIELQREDKTLKLIKNINNDNLYLGKHVRESIIRGEFLEISENKSC